MCPKDQWLIDCINNFLCEEDLTSSIIKKIKSAKTPRERLSLIGKLSVDQKNRIIRQHENNLKKCPA